MGLLASLGAGVAGAVALNLIHEGARHSVPDAPRMDILGRLSVAYSAEAAGLEPPRGDALQAAALGGDLVANSLFYSAVGVAGPDRAPLVGTLMGIAAGVGGVALPGPMGLPTKPSARTPQTALMTVAWYALGGLAAGLAYQALSDR